MALYILGTFYVTMALAGYLVEIIFGALGIIPTNRAVSAIGDGPSWNYTSVLNLIFLALAGALIVRFLRSGGPAMLRMMDAPNGNGMDDMSHDASSGGTSTLHAHLRDRS